MSRLPAPFPIIAVLGPTATGKTSIAIKLAKRLGGEIVNLDSIQIYRGLDIGSAKPTKDELSSVPHHLIDILDPDQVIDALEFAQKASRAVENILLRGKVAILAGGTGFYLRSIFHGLSPLPGKRPAIRFQLKNWLNLHGRDYLYEILKGVDPESAKKISKHDTYRLIRSLEVYMATSIPYSALCRRLALSRPFDLGNRAILKLGLILDRSILYERIDKRVDEMIEAGFVKEVQRLLDCGYAPGLKPLQSIGYRHIISYLSGDCSLEDAVREMKRDTRHYAKRQITWFKKEPGIRWHNPFCLLASNDIWQEIN